MKEFSELVFYIIIASVGLILSIIIIIEFIDLVILPWLHKKNCLEPLKVFFCFLNKSVLPPTIFILNCLLMLGVGYLMGKMCLHLTR